MRLPRRIQSRAIDDHFIYIILDICPTNGIPYDPSNAQRKKSILGCAHIKIFYIRKIIHIILILL